MGPRGEAEARSQAEKGCGAGSDGGGAGGFAMHVLLFSSRCSGGGWTSRPTEIEQQLIYYSQTDSPLPLTEFDRLLFTGVYCAYQIRSVQGLDKNLWIRFFSQLADEIFRDLCKGLCPANSTLLQASWPWKEKPSHLASLKHFYRSNLAKAKRDT